MARSICKGKRVVPNKCKRLKGCKVASGKKRTYCRKAHNKSANRTRKVRTHHSDGLKLNKKQIREIKRLR